MNPRIGRPVALLMIMSTTTTASTADASAQAAVSTSAPAAERGPGPAGSLLIVEPVPALPLVSLVIAARTGAAADPRGKEGLAAFAAELARRGAAGRPREQIEDALDALGATLEVDVDPDSTRLWGQVLVRNLDPFLDLVASIVLRPDFKAEELERTRKEIIAQIEEARNDDRSLCARFFERRLYGAHPYGHPAEGTASSLAGIRREDVLAQHRKVFVGDNLVFAAAGGITTADLRQRLESRFAKLAAGPVPARLVVPEPARHDGWRIQLVDKPDRQQTQIMFGHPVLPAGHPDRLPLQLAIASFGGRAMNATLMDEVRTKRGLAYGAYMNLAARRGPGALRGWVFTSRKSTVTTLKLVLRLFKKLGKEGISPERLRFVQGYVVGAYASDMDEPQSRLTARVTAEINGLPADEVETFPERVRAVTAAQVSSAIERHLHPEHLAITLVASASEVVPLLVKSKIEEGAIDIVPWDRD
jgi:zinc protease